MNPFTAIIALFAQFTEQLRAKANAVLKDLPPLESIEAAQSVIQATREMKWIEESLVRISDEANRVFTEAASKLGGFEIKPGEPVHATAERMAPEIARLLADQSLAASVLNGTHFLAETHQELLTAAADKARREAADEFARQQAAKDTITARRAELAATVGAVASATLDDAALLAETYTDTAAALKVRVDRLFEAGITETLLPKNYAAMLACGFDGEGEAAFDAALDRHQEIRAAAPAPAAPPAAETTTPPAPAVPGSTAGSGSASRAPVI